MPDLPTVSEAFEADIGPFIAAIHDARDAMLEAAAAAKTLQATIDSLHGKTIEIGLETTGTAANAAAAAVDNLAGAENRLSAASQLQVEWSAQAAREAQVMAGTADVLTESYARNAETAGLLIGTDRVLAGESSGLAGAMLATGAAAAASGAAAGAAWRPWWAFGNNFLTVAHWVVAGSAEFLAVAIPAAVALGAGLAVAAQGAQNVQQHFQALYAATESTYSAMHQTVGSVLGLGSALQNAQNAANPGVYEILGSAVNDAKSRFADFASIGLQVVHMFDEFSARVTVDLTHGLGTELHGLLSGAAADLQQFGQILGNLGHALLNFASAMPGLAHFLLGIADGLSSVIEMASRAGPLLTFAMGLEEMYRWGGLALSLLTRLTGQFALMNSIAAGGGFIARFGASVLALGSGFARALTAVGSFIAGIGILPGLTSRVGAGLQTMGAEMEDIAASMSPLMVAGIAGIVAAMGGLILMSSHLKDNLQQLSANAVTAVQSASAGQFLSVAAAQYAKLDTAVQQVSVSFSHMSTGAREAGAVASSSWAQWNPLIAGLGGLGRLTAGAGAQISALGAGFAKMPTPVTGAVGAILSFFGAFAPAAKASADLTALHAAEASVAGTTQTFFSNLGYLGAQFHTTAVGALALASAAGVNLTQGLLKGTEAGQIAVQMINNLKAGLGAMQAPASEIGADMNAIGVQSQLASSKVATVNQAMDAFIAGTTGGMNAVMQFNAALSAMGKDTVAGSQSLTGQISSISNSASKLGYTLQGIGPHAQQSWQQFDAAVQQGNTVLDTFRTGMAEGVVTQQQYTNEIKAVGGALLPFAANNKTALAIVSQLAQEMGAPATSNLKTLAGEFGVTGKAAQNMATVGMEQAIARMANLNTVARNLSVTVGTQLDSVMASAITKFSGVQGAAAKYAQALSNVHTPASVLAKDQANYNTAMQREASMTATVTGDMGKNATALSNVGSAAKTAASNTGDFTTKLSATHGALSDVISRANQAAQNTQSFGQQAHTAATSAQGLSSNAQQATTQVRNLGSAAQTTQGHLGDVNNEIRTAATAAGNSAGPLSGMISNIQRVGSDAMTAAGQVRTLEGAIASLQSKSITLTTNMVTVTSTVHRQHGGPVWPGIPAVVGEAGPELFIPSQAGYIMPNSETERFLSSPGGPSAGTGGGGGGFGTINLTHTTHVTAMVDQTALFDTVKTETARYAVRNGNPQQGRLAPGKI